MQRKNKGNKNSQVGFTETKATILLSVAMVAITGLSIYLGTNVLNNIDTSTIIEADTVSETTTVDTTTKATADTTTGVSTQILTTTNTERTTITSITSTLTSEPVITEPIQTKNIPEPVEPDIKVVEPDIKVAEPEPIIEVVEPVITEPEKEQQVETAQVQIQEINHNVPNDDGYCHSDIKTFMGYQAVTVRSSPQYKLLNGENAYTDATTGLRMVDGRYCIALGSYYTTTIGQKIDLIMEDGHTVECILGDAKADCHTNYTHQYGSYHGDVAEFIIDNTVYYNVYDGSGTVNWIPNLSGKIISVVLVD